MVTRALLLRLADSPRVERFVKSNRVATALARRFVAGDKLEDVVVPVRALNQQGITASLDHLGENVASAAEARESSDYYRKLLRFIDGHGLDANVSLKLTQLGLDISEDTAFQHMAAILDEANQLGQFVRIDMEGSAYTERTLALFYRLWADFRNVGVVLQSYLYRSQDDLERLVAAGARIRLVKGAYSEPKDVAYPQKADVDARYVEMMRLLLDRGSYPAIATHDTAIIGEARRHAVAHGVGSDRYEFQMLYGIRRDLQVALPREGYRMRVYVPFGTQWYGYTMRRLAERPANLWFAVRHIFRR